MPSTERRSRRVRAAVCGCGSRTPWPRMADVTLLYSPAEQPNRIEKKRDREPSEIPHRSPHTFLPPSPLTPHQTIYIKEPDRARVQDAKKEIPPPRPTRRRLHPPRASQRHSLLSNHMASPGTGTLQYEKGGYTIYSSVGKERRNPNARRSHCPTTLHLHSNITGGLGLLQPRAKHDPCRQAGVQERAYRHVVQGTVRKNAGG